MEKIIYHSNGTIFFVKLECDENERLKRLELPSRKKFGKITDPTLYQKLSTNGCFYVHNEIKPHLIINTEFNSISDAVSIIESITKI